MRTRWAISMSKVRDNSTPKMILGGCWDARARLLAILREACWSQLSSNILAANYFIMTIFLPFQSCILVIKIFSIAFGQDRFFKNSFKRKKMQQNSKIALPRLNSRFYPDISFQSMKKFSPLAFYRGCTMVWRAYCLRHD